MATIGLSERRFNRLMDRFNSVCKDAYSFEWTHDMWLSHLKDRVYSTDDYQKLTRADKGRFTGFYESFHNRLYCTEYDHKALLVWVLIGPDGQQFGPGDDRWLQETTEYKQSMTGSTHAWRKAWERGELKPW